MFITIELPDKVRRHKLDDPVLQQVVIKAREQFFTFKECASIAGIDLQTLQSYRKKNPKFNRALTTDIPHPYSYADHTLKTVRQII